MQGQLEVMSNENRDLKTQLSEATTEINALSRQNADFDRENQNLQHSFSRASSEVGA